MVSSPARVCIPLSFFLTILVLVYILSGQLHQHASSLHAKLHQSSTPISSTLLSELNGRLQAIESRLSFTSPHLSPTCRFPFVYNKPHKTASTKIQRDIIAWAKSQHRPVYNCSVFIATANMQMRECIPQQSSTCGIVATHVILSPVMRQILTSRIGNFWTVTSTRKPRDRLLSLFLQTHHTRSQKLGSDLPLLEQFLTSLNPWALYNYHTGENRKGSCPITEEDKILLRDAVNQYDIVIDADLKEHSNEILKANDLFLLSDDSSNRRGAKDLVLTSELKELLKEKTCVEDELHLLFRLRMASSYENVTGTPCLQRTRQPKTTCF